MRKLLESVQTVGACDIALVVVTVFNSLKYTRTLRHNLCARGLGLVMYLCSDVFAIISQLFLLLQFCFVFPFAPLTWSCFCSVALVFVFSWSFSICLTIALCSLLILNLCCPLLLLLLLLLFCFSSLVVLSKYELKGTPHHLAYLSFIFGIRVLHYKNCNQSCVSCF